MDKCFKFESDHYKIWPKKHFPIFVNCYAPSYCCTFSFKSTDMSCLLCFADIALLTNWRFCARP